MTRRAALLAAALMAVGAALAALAEPAPRTAVVTFADGSTLPLRSWALSYDYITWPAGSSQISATTHQKKADEIWLGKKRFPAAGGVLSMTFADLRREILVDGRPQFVLSQVAREVEFTSADGKKSKAKVEAPHRDLLADSLDKKTLLLARSLDLTGETITGGRRTLCLLSFSTLVDCGSSRADLVAKVEFSR